ncbi:sulfite exporter TauE/SafE family protein [Roseivirga echinicomitans]|uniref:Probable membrane transporter protein n=1 Tax=Roseivirga echinicomitans TaxID=296218 RepID=A0A150XUK0_9BACT|nr:sulfite exporter TauE/SafE family protein [Roseivirga echinicomitans]KYG82429.1 integrase [Roseivirga echinicomitans]
MDYQIILVLLAVGLIAGCLNTLAGGGSLLALPVMIFLGLPPNVANATNRVAIVLQNIFAVLGFKSKGISAYPFNIWLGISAFFGAILGAFLAVDINEDVFNKILAFVIVGVVIYMALNPLKNLKKEENTSKKATLTSIIIFFFIGIYGGFIQAGVGYLMIMALTLVNGFSLVKTNSIKVFVALTYTSVALAIFIYYGIINWEFGIPLAIGQACGGWLASRWSVKLGDNWIRYFVMITASVFAIKLFFF